MDGRCVSNLLIIMNLTLYTLVGTNSLLVLNLCFHVELRPIIDSLRKRSARFFLSVERLNIRANSNRHPIFTTRAQIVNCQLNRGVHISFISQLFTPKLVSGRWQKSSFKVSAA